MNTIHIAIMAAAASIEERPELFKFDTCQVPDIRCGTPGCALGWIASHLGYDEWADNRDFFNVIGVEDDAFYERMAEISGGEQLWMDDPTTCANTLRKYADRYHFAPAEGN